MQYLLTDKHCSLLGGTPVTGFDTFYVPSTNPPRFKRGWGSFVLVPQGGKAQSHSATTAKRTSSPLVTPGYVANPPSRESLVAKLQAKCTPMFNRQALGTLATGPLIAGYVTTWDCPTHSCVVNGRRELFRKGAFQHLLGGRSFVQALASHHADLLVASTSHRTLYLEEDNTGLFALVNPQHCEWGSELLHLVRSGDLAQMSFNAGMREHRVAPLVSNNGETFVAVTLLRQLSEVSFVEHGAYQSACVVIGDGHRATNAARVSMFRAQVNRK